MNTILNHHFPLHMFDNPNPFQRASKVQSQPITPIELPPDRGFQYPSLGIDHHRRRTSLYDPLILADPPTEVISVLPHYQPSPFNPSIDPSALHFGVLPGASMDFLPSPAALSACRPSNAASSSTSYNVHGGTPYSRRGEHYSSGHSHSKSLGSNVAGPSGEPYFCRTPNATLRQRTAQACEKCRDRKTKCSGDRPVCKRCSDRGLKCEWAPETRVRGHSRSNNLKGSTRLTPGDNEGEPIESLPHPIPGSSAPNVSNVVNPVTGKAIEKRAKPKHSPSLSLNLPISRPATTLAAQRMSWPRPMDQLAEGPTMAKAVAFDVPKSIAVGSLEEETWDAMWANGRQPSQHIDAAPVPGRYFDFSPLITSSFDYGAAAAGSASTSSRGSTPPSTTNTSRSSIAIDYIPEHFQPPRDLSVEMLELFGEPSECSLPSSSSASPASAPASFDNIHDFTVAHAKEHDNTSAEQVTPTPHVVSASDEQFMSQFLTPDFLGYI